MAGIPFVLAETMLLSIVGLILLQGRSDVQGSCSKLLMRSRSGARGSFQAARVLICASLPVYDFFPFLQCKVFLALWSCPSSTPEVSRFPAGCLAPRRSCLRQAAQSPDPSAARVIPTRIKSASTTATWISSGSTLPSKTSLGAGLLKLKGICRCSAVRQGRCAIRQPCRLWLEAKRGHN